MCQTKQDEREEYEEYANKMMSKSVSEREEDYQKYQNELKKKFAVRVCNLSGEELARHDFNVMFPQKHSAIFYKYQLFKKCAGTIVGGLWKNDSREKKE